MTATQGNLASLSRFIFRAPNWYASLAFALCIAALTGVAAFDSRFVLDDAWQGIFFIGLPTAIAGAVTPWVDRRIGGQLTPNRASLLALVCELITIAFLTAAGVIALVSSRLGANFVFDVLLVALASIFAFRLLILLAVSRYSFARAVVPAGVQTAAAAGMLAVYGGTTTYILDDPQLQDLLARTEQAPPALQGFIPADFVLLAVICLLYAGAVWVFLVAIDQPWRSSLGVSALDFLRGFVGYLAEGSDELETFFEDIGEEAIVPVTVLAVRRPDGEEKARFVLPMIHPGPMGEIGGGNLPERVAEVAEGVAFPPHATAGHDFNLVTEREVDSLLDAVARAESRLRFAGGATPSVRVERGEASVLGQRFDDSALLVSTFAPGVADDIQFGAGMPARRASSRQLPISAVCGPARQLDGRICNDKLLFLV